MFLLVLESLEALDVAVGFERGQQDIDEPQREKEQCGEDAMASGPAQLPTNVSTASVQQGKNSKNWEDAEER